MIGDRSLKRLLWRELKRLPWCVTENATLLGDKSLKRVPWHVTLKAMMMGDGSLKRLLWCELKRLRWCVTEKVTLTWTEKSSFTELYMKLLLGSDGYKSTSRERELRCIHTHRPHTLGSKEPEPWSPRWVRQKLREANNGLPPNDPSHDEKPPADVERPLWKYDLDCQSYMSLDHDTYGMRYWSCPLSTSLFNWGWDEEKPWKVVSVATFTLQDFTPLTS
jgi:hypothetical protein